MTKEKESTAQPSLANPGPVGLLGFGMTTILLNIHNAGFFPLSAMILGMGIFYGGLAQVLAGILEFKKGNTFGYTAFTSYGMFWLTLVFLIVAPKWGITEATDPHFMACFLFLWGLFTMFMFFGTRKKSIVLQFVFASLTVLFFLLGLANSFESTFLHHLAGYEGIICGASAFYLGCAEALADTRGRKILPF